MEISDLSSEQEDQIRTEAILKATPLPPEIESMSIELKNDHTGVPSMYLSFEVRGDVDLGAEKIDQLSRYMTGIVDKLLRSGISRFPYASLDQAA